jgi:hypothetical protein
MLSRVAKPETVRFSLSTFAIGIDNFMLLSSECQNALDKLVILPLL